jgi:membrane associated rhomboid family serine protease
MVMPLYDDNPFKLPHRPIVTWGLIALNLAVMLIEFCTDAGAQEMVYRFGLIPAVFNGEAAVPDGMPPMLTIVSYMFLHADAGHIFGNMIFLWVFGDNVEEALGRWRFLAFYLLCGMLGGLAFVASERSSEVPLIGASGAIAGIVIAYVMLRPCAKVTVLVSIIPLRLSAYWVIGAFVIMQIVNLSSASRSDVAYWCHVGGMLAGAVLFPLMRPAGVKLFQCLRPGDLPSEVPAETVVPVPVPYRIPRAPHGGV